jgi:hypothetical protein
VERADGYYNPAAEMLEADREPAQPLEGTR